MANRNYRCSDAKLLVVSNVVMENFEQHKDQLIAKRKTWADPFADELKSKIEKALDILGINTKIEQTATTRQLVNRQAKALENVTTFKIQTEVDFEDDPGMLKQIEDALGFSKSYDRAKSGSQEALIELLTTFKINMTPELRKKIENAGTDGAIIDELIDMRDEINTLNVQQEMLKGSTTRDTALNVEELNDIYKQVIGICKIAPRLLPHVPTAAEDFSFSRILNRLS